MKDLIITGETLTNTLLVMPKSNLVIADKMGVIRNKEGAVIGSFDDEFTIVKETNRASKFNKSTNSFGIVICGTDKI